MKIQHHEEYRGATLTYIVSNREWVAERDNNTIGSAAHLLDLRKVVDKHLNEESGFRGMEAIYHSYGDFVPVKITSITEEGDVWVVKRDLRREKIGAYNVKSLFKNTPENLQKIEKIKQLKKQADLLRDEAEEIEGEMECVNIPKEPT